jgi:hypothetical protein
VTNKKIEPIFTNRLRSCRTRDHNGWPIPTGVGVVTMPDYVAIGVLIVLLVWAVADWVPRGKL